MSIRSDLMNVRQLIENLTVQISDRDRRVFDIISDTNEWDAFADCMSDLDDNQIKQAFINMYSGVYNQQSNMLDNYDDYNDIDVSEEASNGVDFDDFSSSSLADLSVYDRPDRVLGVSNTRVAPGFKKPVFRFGDYGIPVGARLTYTHNENVRPVVADDRHVKYDGRTWTLSGLATNLRPGVQSNGMASFKYKGEKLSHMRSRMDANRDDDLPLS